MWNSNDMAEDRQRKKTGTEGEDIACRYLTEKGHVVLKRNWRVGHLEIDLITLADDGIHFVEVKTRRTPVQGRPQDSVNAAKQRNMANAAKRFLNSREAERLGDVEVTFDVVSIVISPRTTEIEHIQQAFIPIYT